MDWFRFYNETIDDPKMRKLDDKSFRIFVFLLCLASESEDRGRIYEAEEDIIWRLRIKEKDYHKAISILESLDIISFENNILIINNWNKRQFESDDTTKRVKRFRERKRNVTVTPPDTEQIQNRTDTEAEQTQTVSQPPVDNPPAQSPSEPKNGNDKTEITELVEKIFTIRHDKDMQAGVVNFVRNYMPDKNSNREAIYHCLNRLLEKLNKGEKVEVPYKYLEHIFKTENGNFNERDYQAAIKTKGMATAGDLMKAIGMKG